MRMQVHLLFVSDGKCHAGTWIFDVSRGNTKLHCVISAFLGNEIKVRNALFRLVGEKEIPVGVIYIEFNQIRKSLAEVQYTVVLLRINRESSLNSTFLVSES